MDIATTTEPKSDQQNFDDYIAGPKTVTVSEVKKGTSDQPVEVHLVEFPGRPFKPSKSMRRVLVAAWGGDAANYPGRRIRLYGDPTVKFGGKQVGGIRISHLSHLDGPVTVQLTVTRGSRAPFTVEPLPTPEAPAERPIGPRRDEAVHAFQSIGVTQTQLEEYLQAGIDQWAGEHIAALIKAYQAITQDGLPKEDYFPETTEN